jgi:predicted dehydrogenase
MMDNLNIAIVGYGGIAKTHALAMSAANIRQSLPFTLTLSHVVTARKDSVFVPNAVICGSIEEAVSTGDIDIIDICSVNSAHLQSVEKAIQFGKAIYCEKPLAGTVADAKRIRDLAEENGAVTGTPLVFRYLPCVRMLKKALEEKTLGDVITFKALYYHKSYLNPAKRKSWRTGTDAGGGALLDLGIHMLDAIRVLFGEAKNITHKKHIHFENVAVDEICLSELVMQNGIPGSLESARVYAQRKQQIEITVYCENGSFKCDFATPYELEINDFNLGTRYQKPTKDDEFAKYFASEGEAINFHIDAHIACLSDFARKVYDGSDSGFGADFNEAYLSQLLTE